jgi:hypothetical protein
MREQVQWYSDEDDHPPFLKALADVRSKAMRSIAGHAAPQSRNRIERRAGRGCERS